VSVYSLAEFARQGVAWLIDEQMRSANLAVLLPARDSAVCVIGSRPSCSLFGERSRLLWFARALYQTMDPVRSKGTKPPA